MSIIKTTKILLIYTERTKILYDSSLCHIAVMVYFIGDKKIIFIILYFVYNKYFQINLQVLTKDSVTVSVDAVVYYRVNNATISIANVENAHHSTRLLAQTTLRNTMGTRPLHEILSERETISGNMQVNMVTLFIDQMNRTKS